MSISFLIDKITIATCRGRLGLLAHFKCNLIVKGINCTQSYIVDFTCNTLCPNIKDIIYYFDAISIVNSQFVNYSS